MTAEIQQNKVEIAAHILKDDRATHNFVSRKFVEKNQLQIKDTQQ